VIAVSVLGVIIVVLIWNQLLYKPANNDVTTANQRLTTAQTKHEQLQQQEHALEHQQSNAPQLQAQLGKLEAAVPPTPDLEGFLRAANNIKVQSGVDWVSIQPDTPTSGNGASEIKMQIVVHGGFFQVLDYLNRLADPSTMPRLVIVDGLSLSAASTASTSSGSSSTPTTTASASSGAPDLTATLNARMFTQAAPPDSGTTGGTTGGTGGTSGGGTTPTTSSGTGTTVSTGAAN